MLDSLFRVAAGITILLLLVACSGSEQTEVVSPLKTSVDLPGVHLAYVDVPPQGFQTITSTSQIYESHEKGEDIWLYARTEDLTNPETAGSLPAWLEAIEALQFPQEEGTLFWIPADPQTDLLVFSEKSNLTDAIEPVQQAKLWRYRGDQLRTEGDYDSAIDAYQRAINLDPADPEPYAGLGASYMGKGWNEDAIVLFQKTIELAPDHYWAHRLMGNAYLNLQRYDLAANELTQAYILRPQDAHLLVGVALGQGRSGHPDEALRVLDLLFARTDDPQLLADGELLRQEFSQNQP
jgi:tetratricopeptide (TPR) repeat protein